MALTHDQHQPEPAGLPAGPPAESPAGPPVGRHRHPRTWQLSGVTGVAAALLAGAVLLLLPSPDTAPRDAAAGPLTVQRVWPDARPRQLAGKLADATPYTPLGMLDATTPVGTAPSPDGKRSRLMLGDPTSGPPPRELHSLPVDAQPGFSAIVVSGENLIWSETVPAADGATRTTLWAAPRDGAARLLTADTGDVVFLGSNYDLVVADGRVYWAAAGRSATPTTEIRSVPLAGGTVLVNDFAGAYALAAWPWLTPVGSGQTGSIELVELRTRKTRKITAQPGELVTCGPAWCRMLLLGDASNSRLDLMHPDGTARQRLATGTAMSPAVPDVGLLDRFEVLAAETVRADASQRLLLYDTNGQRTMLVAERTGVVASRGGYLWWSIETGDAVQWHILDLRALT